MLPIDLVANQGPPARTDDGARGTITVAVNSTSNQCTKRTTDNRTCGSAGSAIITIAPDIPGPLDVVRSAIDDRRVIFVVRAISPMITPVVVIVIIVAFNRIGVIFAYHAVMR